MNFPKATEMIETYYKRVNLQLCKIVHGIYFKLLSGFGPKYQEILPECNVKYKTG